MCASEHVYRVFEYVNICVCVASASAVHCKSKYERRIWEDVLLTVWQGQVIDDPP